jgi:hypothetical protein
MYSIFRNYMLLIKYLCVTWCGSVPLDSSYVLLWIDTIVLFFVSIAVKTINNIENDYQRIDISQMENGSENLFF